MKRFFTLLMISGFLLMTCDITASAQDGKQLKKANELFEEYNYPKAAELYKKILTNADNVEAKRKLADCYRLMSQPIEAEFWYEQIVELDEVTESDLLNYGMMLKMNGKCDLARDVFLQYAQKVPADTRGLRLVESCDKEEYFLQDPGVYQLDFLKINSVESDFGPAFFEEGIVFASARGGKYQDRTYSWTDSPYLDLFYSEGEAGSEKPVLKNAKLFKGKPNTWLHEGTVTFSRDQNTMYFTRNNFMNGKKGMDSNKTIRLKVYSSEREDETWGEIKELPFNSDNYSVGHPTLTADGSELYFVSDMPGGYGEEDIYVVYKEGDSWGSPVNLGPEINTEGREMFPFITDEETLYFASDALPGLGGLDIFETQQNSDGSWQPPANLRTPVNTNDDDFGMILSSDGGYGYFASNRSGGEGDDDIYGFSRTTYVMNGVVVDVVTQEPIDGAIVQLVEDGVILQERVTYANGEFNFPISPDRDYQVLTFKPNYQDGEQLVSTEGLTTSNVEVKVPMSPDEFGGINCELRGLVYEEIDGKTLPVVGANVKLMNIETKFEKNYTTGEDGSYLFELDPETDYEISATKEYYFTKDKKVSTKGRDCASPLMKDLALDVLLKKIEVDEQVGNNGGNNSSTYYDKDGNIVTDVVNGQTYYDKDGNIVTAGDSSGPYFDEYGNQVTDLVIGETYYDKDGNPIKYNGGNYGGDTGLIPDDVLSINHIYYDLNKAFIRPDAATELDKVVELMYKNPGIRIQLESHTDARSSDSYNLDLSQKRATSAVNYIVRKGIAPDRIVARGYGESQLINQCANGVTCSESDHQENRRTEFRVIGYSTNAVTSAARYFGSGGFNSGNDSYNSGGSSTNENPYEYEETTTTNYEQPTSYEDTDTPVTKPTYVGSATSDDIYDNDVPTYFDQDETYTSPTGEEINVMSFKIQLGAFRQLNMNRFTSLKDLGFIEVEEANGGSVKKVVLGKFNERGFAENILQQVRDRGFRDAFVVTYVKGERQ